LSEDEIAGAIRIYYTDTHNLVEGADAAALPPPFESAGGSRESALASSARARISTHRFSQRFWQDALSKFETAAFDVDGDWLNPAHAASS
jgi:hypothetical protein